MLTVSGPIAVKQFIAKGYAVDRSMDMARAGLSLRTQQWALAAGRMLIRNTTRRDREARGYRRVTDGSPCAFCAMLVARDITRGDFRDASFKAHRNCGCSAEPVYGEVVLTDTEEAWVGAYDDAAKAARAAGEKITQRTVLPRMRRMHPDLFSDGVRAR